MIRANSQVETQLIQEVDIAFHGPSCLRRAADASSPPSGGSQLLRPVLALSLTTSCGQGGEVTKHASCQATQIAAVRTGLAGARKSCMQRTPSALRLTQEHESPDELHIAMTTNSRNADHTGARCILQVLVSQHGLSRDPARADPNQWQATARAVFSAHKSKHGGPCRLRILQRNWWFYTERRRSTMPIGIPTC